MAVACFIDGLFNGTLWITPDAAAHLVQKGIIQATKKLGHFKLKDEEEDRLWQELRKR